MEARALHFFIFIFIFLKQKFIYWFCNFAHLNNPIYNIHFLKSILGRFFNWKKYRKLNIIIEMKVYQRMK